MKKIPYVKKNGDGLHYVNEKHCCFGKNSPEDDTKDRGSFFQRWCLKKLHFNLILLLVDLAFENYAQKYLQHNY